jgi:hypothetical protein
MLDQRAVPGDLQVAHQTRRQYAGAQQILVDVRDLPWLRNAISTQAFSHTGDYFFDR